METLFEFIGEVFMELAQELWPPLLGIVDGLLVVALAFCSWLFFTTGQPVKGALSLLFALVFLAAGILWLKSGACKRRPSKSTRRKRR